ncbi:MAG TPA: di-heme oxidoredictase family protein [Labilithrix sp.]|nr:di-heme oxidoredictase family protein [Labilithrix sp.]
MSRLPRLVPVAVVAFALAAAGCRRRPPAHETAPVATALPVVAPREAAVRPVSRPQGSTVVIAEVDGKRFAIAADEAGSALQIIDLEARTFLAERKLDGAPGQLLLAPDGTLFVALRGAARVAAFRFVTPGTLREIATRPTADEPFGLALTPDAATHLLTTIGEPRLEALRAADLTPVFGVVLPRDPRSVAVTGDGARAYVTHATGSITSIVDVAGGAPGRSRVAALDARERRRDFGVSFIRKPMPPMEDGPWGDVSKSPGPREFPRVTMTRTATQGFGLAMIGERVLLPETLVMTSDNEQIPSGYGSIESSTLSTHVPFLARVHERDEKLENTTLSGPQDRLCFEQKAECIVPRAVTDDGQKVYVACLDSDEILVVDPARDAEHAPACLRTIQERPRLRVESPTGVAFDAARSTIVAFSSLARKITIGPSSGGEPDTEIALPASAPAPPLVALGRALFHRSADPRVARNGRTCASCHVEGRDDGLVWPTPSGKRQTPMLAGRIDGTAPYGWNGEHASLVQHITSTIKNLEGTGLEPAQLDALAAYVTSMNAPARRAHASSEIARGQSIFRSSEAACSSCHVEDTRFTDHETHALSASAQKKRVRPTALFDTPSLAFVGQTAPYFHDGRFATLEQLIDACEDPDTGMGRTKHLPAEDRRALVAYLRSL